MRHFPKHAIGIYDNKEELITLLRAYFIAARHENRRILVLFHGEERDHFLNRLDSPALNLQQGISEGWFFCDQACNAYAPTGKFSSSEMYDRINKAAMAATSSGYAGLSIAGVMSWSHDMQVAPEVLADYEYGLDPVFEKQPELQGLCLYSRVEFDRQDIALQCLCHPHVVTLTESINNPLSELKTRNNGHFDAKKNETARYWGSVAALSTPIERISGKRAAFAKMILEKMRIRVAEKFTEAVDLKSEDINNSCALLKQIDFLGQKIDYFNLIEKA